MNEEYMLRQQWLAIVMQAFNRGLAIEDGFAQADKMVAAYRLTFPTNSETN